MSELQTGELLALATAMLWTLSSLAWTSAGKRIGALAVGFIRLVIAGVFMMIYCRVTRGLWLPSDADTRTWLLMGGSGFCGFFLCDICLFKAMLLIGPRLSLLLFSLSPPIAAIIAWVCIGDELALRQWVAMGVTLAGIVWVVMEQPEHSGRPCCRAITGAASSWACWPRWRTGSGWFSRKRNRRRPVRRHASHVDSGHRRHGRLHRANHALVPLVRHASGGARRKGRGHPDVRRHRGTVRRRRDSLVALRNAPTGIVATIIATMPVLILPFSILLYHEKVSLRAVGGAIVAVAGVAMLMISTETFRMIMQTLGGS